MKKQMNIPMEDSQSKQKEKGTNFRGWFHLDPSSLTLSPKEIKTRNSLLVLANLTMPLSARALNVDRGGRQPED